MNRRRSDRSPRALDVFWGLLGFVSAVACGGSVDNSGHRVADTVGDGGGAAGSSSGGTPSGTGGVANTGSGGASIGGTAGSSSGGVGSGGASCNGGVPFVPTVHRPVSVMCPANSEAKPCQDGGIVGPCGDGCLRDSDCGAQQTCTCDGTVFGWSHQSAGSVCIPSNCRTDADCASGYCSPSYGDGGPFYGVQGYYCHTCQDTCGSDSDCGGPAGTTGPAGYCAYQPTSGAWACAYTFAAG